jgi:predicted kinase
MENFFLIIITGSPGAGKTILARRLARDLGLPLITKDGIKEMLFDTLGWQDREHSQKLGHASFELMFYFLECQLTAGKPAIAETAFWTKFHTPRFLILQEKYGFEPIQIFCRAETDLLFERFQKRVESGERHPGHIDHLAAHAQFIEVVSEGRYGRLEIGGSLFEIDTTDFQKIDYEGLQEVLASMILP